MAIITLLENALLPCKEDRTDVTDVTVQAAIFFCCLVLVFLYSNNLYCINYFFSLRFLLACFKFCMV